MSCRVVSTHTHIELRAKEASLIAERDKALSEAQALVGELTLGKSKESKEALENR